MLTNNDILLECSWQSKEFTIGLFVTKSEQLKPFSFLCLRFTSLNFFICFILIALYQTSTRVLKTVFSDKSITLQPIRVLKIERYRKSYFIQSPETEEQKANPQPRTEVMTRWLLGPVALSGTITEYVTLAKYSTSRRIPKHSEHAVPMSVWPPQIPHALSRD